VLHKQKCQSISQIDFSDMSILGWCLYSCLVIAEYLEAQALFPALVPMGTLRSLEELRENVPQLPQVSDLVL
jgi:hypothetical protein